MKLKLTKPYRLPWTVDLIFKTKSGTTVAKILYQGSKRNCNEALKQATELLNKKRTPKYIMELFKRKKEET